MNMHENLSTVEKPKRKTEVIKSRGSSLFHYNNVEQPFIDRQEDEEAKERY